MGPSRVDLDPMSDALWQWETLTQGLTGRADAGPDIHGVAFDSRKVQPGDLFIALSGDPGTRFNPSYRSSTDGHNYIDAAATNGARGALIRTDSSYAGTLPVIRVADTYDGLWALGRLARARLQAPVIAVTGSSGKTTAKAFLGHALDAYIPQGSFNNHIGVPISLAAAPEQAAAYVLEIGTNHPGEIEPLAQMCAPDYAVVLNVHQAHIENFSNWAELVKE
ncbi:MAG: Mur ligase family protein, partial [Pseudomonadota bacterium]